MIPGSTTPLLAFKSAAAGQYQISRSLRFNSADSAYLSRTPASAGNRKTWTWSGWVKRSADATGVLFGSSTGTVDALDFSGSNLRLYLNNTSSGHLVTSQVFRDFSAWYHIVLAIDTTQATSSNRARIYVNGTEITVFSTTVYPTLNYDSSINNNVATGIGDRGAGIQPFSGYLADIHFIDGQALTPSSFGETDATTGEWIPKAYTGTYGTNGFKLDFADNSAATAAALGKDTSGNGNNWTPNNLSVTAGAGNDSLVDTPTSYGTDTGAGGEVRGNYCTWNPLIKSTYATISNGNLDILSSNNHGQTLGTIGVSSGKWYWEVTKSTSGSPFTAGFGVMEQQYKQDATWVGSGTGRNFIYLQSGDVNWYDGSVTSGAFTNSTLVNDIGVWMFALDLDAQKMWFGKDGVWYSRTGTTITGPSSGLNAPFTSFNAGSTYFPFHNSDSTAVTYVANFGQRPFAYTAPSGFKALCDTNLTAPTIVKPSTVMDTVLYTGTGASLTPTSSLGFSPDLVWVKSRSAATDNTLYDTVRGTQARLESNNTDAEVTTDGGLTAFNSNGFTLGTLAQVNTSTATYAAWCWDAGSSTVTNTAGTIQSSVRANASAGFSIVTYTGTGSVGTIGHGLNTAPSMVIVKRRDGAADWPVWHKSLTAISVNHAIILNLTDGAASYAGYFNGTSPTSTVFTIYPSTAAGANNYTYVAYCFAPVAGYSAFGSYTGNGNADGPFVYTGFRPRYLLLKNATTAGTNWLIIDSARDTYNPEFTDIQANTSNAENQNQPTTDFLANGFKVRNVSSNANASGATILYSAFAEFPFQYARAR